MTNTFDFSSQFPTEDAAEARRALSDDRFDDVWIRPTRELDAMPVSQLLRTVRDALEHRFPLQWVSGELSNCTQARSEHLYFILKDAQSQVRCVMFRSRNQLLEWQPVDGMRVAVRVLVRVYEPRGAF